MKLTLKNELIFQTMNMKCAWKKSVNVKYAREESNVNVKHDCHLQLHTSLPINTQYSYYAYGKRQYM